MIENLKVKGTLHILLQDNEGNTKYESIEENIIVATGLAHIASRMAGTAQASMGWMELGTGTTGELVGNTLLETYIVGSRTATTPSIVTTTQTNDTVQHVAEFAPGIGTGAVTEAGIFNVVTQNTGTMLNRITFAVVNKGANDSLTLTWKIKIA